MQTPYGQFLESESVKKTVVDNWQPSFILNDFKKLGTGLVFQEKVIL